MHIKHFVLVCSKGPTVQAGRAMVNIRKLRHREVQLTHPATELIRDRPGLEPARF